MQSRAASGSSGGASPPSSDGSRVKRTCCICHADLTGKPRLRDADRFYYCPPCAEKVKASGKLPHAAAAAEPADPKAALIDRFLLENSFSDTSTLKVNCSHCRRAVAETDLHHDYHDLICRSCYEKITSQEERAQLAALKDVAQQEKSAAKPRQIDAPGVIPKQRGKLPVKTYLILSGSLVALVLIVWLLAHLWS